MIFQVPLRLMPARAGAFCMASVDSAPAAAAASNATAVATAALRKDGMFMGSLERRL